MSAHRTVVQRTAVLLVSCTAVTGLAWTGPGAATAHPGVFDSETCAASLTRTWFWPGRISDEPGAPVLHSDAYESYLLRQPPCDGTQAAPRPPGPVPAPADQPPVSSWDTDRAGHGDPL